MVGHQMAPVSPHTASAESVGHCRSGIGQGGVGVEPLQQLGDLRWTCYDAVDEASEVHLRGGDLGKFAGTQQVPHWFERVTQPVTAASRDGGAEWHPSLSCPSRPTATR